MKLECVLAVLLGISLSNSTAQNQKTLCDAVEAGDMATAEKLLAEGAGIESRSAKGWTPLIIATDATNVTMVKLLLEHGADVNAMSSSEAGSTVLCFATRSDDPAFMDLFLARGARINARSRNGVTALYQAALQKNEKATKFLIEKGARIDQLARIYDEPRSDEPGDDSKALRGVLLTPLMGACMVGDVHMAELLLKSGANLEKRNNYGNTVLMETAKGRVPSMLKFLIDHGANVNAKEPTGRTALIYAAHYDFGQTENLKVLLAAGADPNATWRLSDAPDDAPPDERGFDAAAFPSIWGDTEKVALIREAQKKSKPTANQP